MTLRFGLFGTGPWVDETHAAALAAEPAVEFAGVWGRHPEKARSVAGRWGVRAYDDVEALIGDVDAIAVALPPGVQAGIAEQAALAGRHLLLDKPLALDLAAAERVVAAVATGGVRSVIFFTRRFDRSTWLAGRHPPGRTVGWPAGRLARRVPAPGCAADVGEPVAAGTRSSLGRRAARALARAAAAG